VEKICKRKRIKLLYITPHHHYPTTATLTPERRVNLLHLAIRYNFYILEDDYDYDFHYDNHPVLPLASLSKNENVIYIGSFSKCLAPSVRIGYFVAPPRIIEAANKLRRIIDRQGDPVLERAMSEFVRAGDLQRHLKKAVRVYRHKRDYFCSLLHRHLSGKADFSIPEGGMAVWITFGKSARRTRFIPKLEKEGYLLDSDPSFLAKFNSIRVGFASLGEAEMERFVKKLAEALVV
jgi:GntR family transcriptional regulator/MocR family aminotransferase